MNKKKLIISFVAVNIISWISNRCVYDNSNIGFVPKTYRYNFDFLCLMLVTVIGYFGWGKRKRTWVGNLWLIIYLTAIILMTLLGIFNLIVPGGLYHPVKEIIVYLFFFLITPVPFGVLWVLLIIVKKKD